jgi:hypothetical protein
MGAGTFFKEVDSSSASQEIYRVLSNPKADYCIDMSPSLIPPWHFCFLTFILISSPLLSKGLVEWSNKILYKFNVSRSRYKLCSAELIFRFSIVAIEDYKLPHKTAGVAL